MKSKFFFQSDENHYLQDITNNYLLFLPLELFKQIQMCLDTPNFEVEGHSSYYGRKARFLLENLENERSIEQNYTSRLTPELIENSLANARQITFEVTERCNLNCKYCTYGELYDDYLPRQKKDLPLEYAERLIEYLSRYWSSPGYTSVNRAFSIGFYGGEALLKVDLIKKIIQFVNAKRTGNIDFTFAMTTNGILLDQYMDFLVENDIQLMISLDGDEQNNSYRVTESGENYFHTILSNIRLLKERFPEYFKEKVGVASVLHNKNSVSEIYNFFRDQFDTEARITELNQTGIKSEKREKFDTMYRNRRESFYQAEDYDRIKDDMFFREPDTYMLMHYLDTYSGNYFKTFEGFFIDKESVKWLPTGTCIPFEKKVFLTAGGKILPCERIGHQFITGTVDENGVNIDFNEITNRYNQYYDNLKSHCLKCYQLKHCTKCVLFIENIEDKPVCSDYFDEERFKQYLSNNISFLSKNPALYKKIMSEVILDD